MIRPPKALARVLLLAMVLSLAMTGFSAAQECDPAEPDCGVATVTTTATSSNRHLTLHDLTGAELTAVPLRSGQPRPFEVRVNDEALSLDRSDFWVQSYLTNLYLRDGDGAPSADTPIPSGQVKAQFGLDPLGALDVATQLTPRYLLSTTTTLTCSGNIVLGLVQVLTDPVCALLYELNDLHLLSAVEALAALLGPNPVSVAFSDLPVDLPEPLDISLDGLPLSSLPILLEKGPGGAYTNPDCGAAVLGWKDGGCTTAGATPVELLIGQGGSLTGLLEDLLGDELPQITTLVSSTGAGALYSVDELLAELEGSTTALVGSDGTVGELVGFLRSRTPAQLNTLLQAVPADLALDQLTSLTGAWRGFPALRVDTPAGQPSGDYVGTMTVQLMENYN